MAQLNGAQILSAHYYAATLDVALLILLPRRRLNSSLKCPVDQEWIRFLQRMGKSRRCQCPSGYSTWHQATFVTGKESYHLMPGAIYRTLRRELKGHPRPLCAHV